MNDTAIVTILDKSMARAIQNDTIVRHKGKFKYRYTGEKAHTAMVFFKSPNGTARKQIYVVPGAKGVLTGTLDNSQWSGKGFYGDLAKLKNITTPLEVKYGKTVEHFQTQIKSGAKRDSIQQVAKTTLGELSNQLQAAMLNFIKAHPSSGASAVSLSSLEDLEYGLSIINPSLKTGIFSEFIEVVEIRVERLKAQRKARNSQKSK